ncbi:hypothetical protein D3C76_1621900 [compost metagenome]
MSATIGSRPSRSSTLTSRNFLIDTFPVIKSLRAGIIFSFTPVVLDKLTISEISLRDTEGMAIIIS